MRCFDVAVIGGGLLGCFTARNLKRYNLSVALFEEREDVCLGISKANTAVVYPGYDNRPGSLKAKLCVEGNRDFDRLCNELDVSFKRCGSLMLSYGPEGEEALRRKMKHGIENGCEGLRLLSWEETLEIEPGLGDGVVSALWSPMTGTVNPWELCIAAFENAVENGTEPFLNTKVLSFKDGVLNLSEEEQIKAKIVVDCSGLNAGRLSNSKYHIEADGADYIVLDRKAKGIPEHIIFEQDETKCRGITAVPTVEGTLLVGPTHRLSNGTSDSSREGLKEIRETAEKVFPKLEIKEIHAFAVQRPNPESCIGESIHDFAIDVQPGIISLVGIKTPGLTCADKLGMHVASICAAELSAETNKDFISRRIGIKRARSLSFDERAALIKDNPDYGEIICACEDITKAEVLEAIKRGAVTPEGIKHRCGTMMGFCQGSRCMQKISRILEEAGYAEL